MKIEDELQERQHVARLHAAVLEKFLAVEVNRLTAKPYVAAQLGTALTERGEKRIAKRE